MATKTRTIVRYRRPKVHHRSNGGMKLPLAVIAGFLPLTLSVIGVFREREDIPLADGLINVLSRRMIGYNPMTREWKPSDMACGTFAILGGILVHKIVGSTLGVNKVLARAHVPFIRI